MDGGFVNEGINNSECARYGGVSLVAVIKALKLGRIDKVTGGKIDRDSADADWEANTKATKAQPIHAAARARQAAEVSANG